MSWIKTAILVCKARLNYEKNLKQKTIYSLQKLIEIKENKMQFIGNSSEHYNQRLLGNVINKWKKYKVKEQ